MPLPAARIAFDYSAPFIVRRPFIFNAVDYRPGDAFEPAKAEASYKKVLLLWESRKVDVRRAGEDAVDRLSQAKAQMEEQKKLEELTAPEGVKVTPTSGGWYIVTYPDGGAKKLQGASRVEEHVRELVALDNALGQVMTPKKGQDEGGF